MKHAIRCLIIAATLTASAPTPAQQSGALPRIRVLATGGTARAACELIEAQGARVTGCMFLLELEFLAGRSKLDRRPVESLIAL